MQKQKFNRNFYPKKLYSTLNQFKSSKSQYPNNLDHLGYMNSNGNYFF
jgi:hypothetical protein